MNKKQREQRTVNNISFGYYFVGTVISLLSILDELFSEHRSLYFWRYFLAGICFMVIGLYLDNWVFYE